MSARKAGGAGSGGICLENGAALCDPLLSEGDHRGGVHVVFQVEEVLLLDFCFGTIFNNAF